MTGATPAKGWTNLPSRQGRGGGACTPFHLLGQEHDIQEPEGASDTELHPWVICCSYFHHCLKLGRVCQPVCQEVPSRNRLGASEPRLPALGTPPRKGDWSRLLFLSFSYSWKAHWPCLR